MTRDQLNEQLAKLDAALLEAEAYLKSTDYVAAKLAEGEATKEEYSEVLAKRRQAREEINKAQNAIDFLGPLIAEEDDEVSPIEFEDEQ